MFFSNHIILPVTLNNASDYRANKLLSDWNIGLMD